jgi:REP element-mobilizing transposase RayT
MDLPDDSVTRRQRRALPHYERDNTIYFVTFRLADSLPVALLRRVREQLRDCHDDERRRARLEKELDSHRARCWLRQGDVARLVVNALLRHGGERCVLGPWCVMPNHVHAILRSTPAWDLARVLHSWKSYTASAANHLLGRHGAFWQREYYDHLVRDMHELERLARYVLENPDGAGLTNWPWIGRGDTARLVEDG